MNTRKYHLAQSRSVLLLAAVALLIGLPLAGVRLAGKPISAYLAFPPKTECSSQASFSLPAFVVMAVLIAVVVAPFLIRVLVTRDVPQQNRNGRRPFPWWGWAAAGTGLIAWVLAWTRFEWFTPLQPHTFTPLWVCYILTVNALTYQRSGHCLLTDAPRRLLLLFPVSAAFWWVFEYLNRFVMNWHYTADIQPGPAAYVLLASVSFSTVLPAVMSAADLLDTIPRIGAGLDCFMGIQVRRPRPAAWATLAVASLGLAGIGIWPHWLYPLLWVSPLFLIPSIQTLQGRPTLFSPVRYGYWRRIWHLAGAALVCGFFWEMWNVYSASKWLYQVPLVSRFKIFEMPLLGYAGYLPFGLECAVVADLVGHRMSHGRPDNPPRTREPGTRNPEP